jgi:hypothetical protein
MAWDASGGRIVLFGGVVAGQPQQDTWLWDGTTWSAASPTVPPPARAFPALAADPSSGTVLLFGGQGTGGALGDGWVWRSGGWGMTPT